MTPTKSSKPSKPPQLTIINYKNHRVLNALTSMFTESYAILSYSVYIVYSVTICSYSTLTVLYSVYSVLLIVYSVYSVIVSLYVLFDYSVSISNITKVSLYSVILIGSFDLNRLYSVWIPFRLIRVSIHYIVLRLVGEINVGF